MKENALKAVIEEYESLLTSLDNNLEDYYIKNLNNLSKGTKLNHLISISKLFESEKQRTENRKVNKKNYSLEKNKI